MKRGRGIKKERGFFFFFLDCKLRPYALVWFGFLDSRYLKILYDDLVPRIRFKGHTHGSVQDEWVSEASEPTRETPDYEGEQTSKGRGMGEGVCCAKKPWANRLFVIRHPPYFPGLTFAASLRLLSPRLTAITMTATRK